MDLRAEIRNSLATCISLLGGGEFLPEDKIADLITKEIIQGVLAPHGISLNKELMGFIHHEAPKIFLTLVLIRQVSKIRDFMSAGFCDKRLPITTKWGGKSYHAYCPDGTSDKPQSQSLPCFSGWNDVYIELFEMNQYSFLAPVFRDQSFHQQFSSKRPLPFTDKHETGIEGKFGTVHKVTVYKGYLDHERDVVALKKFNDNTDDCQKHFQKEVGIWQEILNLNHSNLIKPLAAFGVGPNCLCIVFPWCDGGNLEDYWRNSNGSPSRELISWTLLQMAGLCDCLTWLYGFNFRHGDLKPTNILHKGGWGNFLIADVGISKIHGDVTEMRNKSTSTAFATYRYQAPEYVTNRGTDTPTSRDFDVWSMGAIFLEWIVRLSNYSEGLATLKGVHTFWQNDGKGQARLDLQSKKLMEEMSKLMDAKMKGANITDHCLKRLLDLVQQRLLVVPRAQNGDLQSGRAKAAELFESMNDIAKNHTYSHEPISLGDVTMEDSFSSQQDTPLRPDRYDKRGKQVDDVWKSRSDHDFGNRILNKFKWSFLDTISSSVALSGDCETINILFSDSQIYYDMLKSGDCSLCALVNDCLLDVGIKSIGVRKLIRECSTIMDETTRAPLISIYRDPKPHVNTQNFAQLGFPQLPKPGSSDQLKLIREWLLNCDRAHECKSPSSPTGESRMPTRLLDVGEDTGPTVWLINTNGQPDFSYIALSHCWGKVPENLRFFTNRTNIQSHEKGIELKMLPRTFQDAIAITRGIGKRYLWIDSLCIIQQDMEDWGVNAGKMETVFSSAYCTIAASSARSSLDGFIHERKDRPCVTIQKDGRKLYLCKYIDNFHNDVERAVLNTRGWVLQERALSRRTIHFTSNQVYLECGDGVQCETLANLYNSKAGFLGDPNFPKSALQYFRDGRIVLFQALYEIYSKLTFSIPTDRSMGIIGLERRLAKTFQTRGDYGVLECYLGRSLIWKRACPGKLERIKYSEDHAVPSWSWMAYSGEISYVSAPFGGVSWNKDKLHIPFGEDGRLRNVTQTLVGKPEPEIGAPVTNINMDAYGNEIRQRLIFDEDTVDDLSTLRCVILGNDKEGDQNTRHYYAIAIQHSCGSGTKHIYKRVGAGSLLERHISTVPDEYVIIR